MWKYYFRKYGGATLLKRLFKNRVLGVAICQFLCLGKSRKALELLRLSVEYKTHQKLRREYGKLGKELASSYNITNRTTLPVDSKIWICWWQGIENAPTLVQRCYNSVKYYLSDWNIIVITQDNYKEYVNFPDYIIDKWKSGIISYTHFSDLLRLELLFNYGGLWLDSTVLCTSADIPKSVLESNLFFYQCLKPGADGHTTVMSSWLMYAKPNNMIICLTRDLLYKYWKNSNELMEYFLIHHFFTIACEIFFEEYQVIPQFCNSTPHILQLNLFNQYNKTYFSDLCKMTCFHKLTYKLDETKVVNSQGTYYEWIMSNKPI